MTLTKRDLVIRISDETNLGQQQVFDVVQKTLDYITESLAKGDKVNCETSASLRSKSARRASGAIRTSRKPTCPSLPVRWSNSNPARKCAPKS